MRGPRTALAAGEAARPARAMGHALGLCSGGTRGVSAVAGSCDGRCCGSDSRRLPVSGSVCMVAGAAHSAQFCVRSRTRRCRRAGRWRLRARLLLAQLYSARLCSLTRVRSGRRSVAARVGLARTSLGHAGRVQPNDNRGGSVGEAGCRGGDSTAAPVGLIAEVRAEVAELCAAHPPYDC